MKKTIFLYLLTIIFIVLIAALMNTEIEVFSFIKFPKWLHIVLEGTNSLLMILIAIASNHMFSKTKNEKLVIIAGGFLIGAIFNTIHIINVNHFPYDIISLESLQVNPSTIYLLIGNLIIPLSILWSLIHKQTQQKPEIFKSKVYAFYTFMFIVLSLCPYLIYHSSPTLIYKFNIIAHSLEFINYSLYLMLAFIVINIRYSSHQTFFPAFTVGLIVLGLGGLFYLSLNYVQANEILAHILQLTGIALLLGSIDKFLIYSSYLRFKDELVAYLCLLVICFYVGFISIVSAIFHVILPPISAYIFVEFILIFQFSIYLISNQVTKPITKIIDALNEYEPGQEYTPIPIMRNDEFGMLTNKINEVTLLSSQKIKDVANIVARENSLIKIFESMQRISNPNIIKNSIIEEIKREINPDSISIALYNKDTDSFYLDDYTNALPSRVLKEPIDTETEKIIIEQLNEYLKNSLELCFSNVDDYIKKNNLEGTEREKILKKYDIKSCCNIPIYYAGTLLGCLVIQYTTKFINWDILNITYLKKMAIQLGTLIYKQT